MLLKPFCWEVNVLNNKGWDRLSMSRMYIPNPSWWSSDIIGNLIHIQVSAETSEIKRSQHEEIYSATNTVYCTVFLTKGTLRIDIPIFFITTGLPKCRKTYGDGESIVAVVRTQKRSYTTRVMSSECEVIQRSILSILHLYHINMSTGLDKLILCENSKKIYHKIWDKERLSIAYKLIKNLTKCVDENTIDNYSKDTINSVSKSLKDHSFSFKPIRRINFAKSDGTFIKYGVPCLFDKVIMKSMTMVLHDFYSQLFFPYFYSYKSKKGKLIAIKEIRKWTGINWLIEGNIKLNLDSTHYHILAELIKKEIHDKEFMDLYWKTINICYVYPSTIFDKYCDIITPQDDILSPLLFNIYLYELDKFFMAKIYNLLPFHTSSYPYSISNYINIEQDNSPNSVSNNNNLNYDNLNNLKSPNNSYLKKKRITLPIDHILKKKNKIISDSVEININKIISESVEKNIISDSVDKNKNKIISDSVEKNKNKRIFDSVDKKKNKIISDSVEKNKNKIISDSIDKKKNKIISDSIDKKKNKIISDSIDKKKNKIISDSIDNKIISDSIDNKIISDSVDNILLNNNNIISDSVDNRTFTKEEYASQNSSLYIKYMRYGEDIIIGVKGPKLYAEKLRQEIKVFIEDKLKLELPLNYINIIDAREGVNYLDYRLKLKPCFINKTSRRLSSKLSIGKRKKEGKMIALAPLEKIVKKLELEGMCRIVDFRNRKIIPTRKTSWLHLSLGQLITKYNKVWTEILKFYTFAYNRSQLLFIQYIILHSAACSIMNKMKLSSRKKVFKKYGEDLTVEENGKRISFKLYKSLKRRI